MGDVEIVRVFNNNILLALDGAGREVILTGWGLGFNTRPGQQVDTAKVARTFVPADSQESDRLVSMLAHVPPERVALVGEALAEVGLGQLAENAALVIALADHLSFALRRVAVGMVLEYPLLAEVTHLYGEEYAQATRLLAAINARAEHELPEQEAVGLTLHLVNAGFATGDLSFTYTMTGVIQQMVAVMEQVYGQELDPGSISIGRFVTHLRYLFVRIHQNRQLDQKHSAVGVAIRQAYPDAVDCAHRLAAILELRLGAPLTDDEVSYLALHVARVASDVE